MPEGWVPPADCPRVPVAVASGTGTSARAVWLVGLAGLLLAAGCSGGSQAQKAALDQDVARDVNWELRKDARFAEVHASCAGGIVALRGRVDSRGVEADALKIAQTSAHGARVLSELEIRPR
ncbi:MAG TPA: hypothetical protein VEN81_11805 [Planctomycetota bacterium]|nr:hypothetical protein [Planctomycetota bacterium]